ncbi:MAG: heme-binding protein [Verrucomicrobiota bacterium]
MKKRSKFVFWVIGLTSVAAAGALFASGRGGYETAEYKTVEKQKKFEIREYPKLPVVSTPMSVSSNDQMDSGFMRLFRYISGGNKDESKIAMTTPVFVTTDAQNSQSMSFVLPLDVANSGAPSPTNRNVRLNQLNSGSYAVYRYSGRRSASRDSEALAKLRTWLSENNYQARPKAQPRFAYYDPPWTPGLMRRNEVMLLIDRP